MVQDGEMAPEFELKGTATPGLRLGDLRGRVRAMLVFYPMDQTTG